MDVEIPEDEPIVLVTEEKPVDPIESITEVEDASEDDEGSEWQRGLLAAMNTQSESLLGIHLTMKESSQTMETMRMLVETQQSTIVELTSQMASLIPQPSPVVVEETPPLLDTPKAADDEIAPSEVAAEVVGVPEPPRPKRRRL